MTEREYDSAAPIYERYTRGEHSRRNAFIAFILIVLVGLAIWEWGGVSSKGASGKGRPATTVGIAKVARVDMPVTLNAIGTVQPIVNATVRSQLSGVLFSVNFTEGQQVSKGTVLAQIDPRPYRMALQQAQGTLAKDIATLNAARVDLQRYKTLLSQDSIAAQQVDTQAATVHQLEGTVQTDRGAVGNAQLNLAYTTVRAPEAGKLGLRQVDVGSYVTPSDANGIVAITQTDPIDVSFTLPQSQITEVQRAANKHTLPVTILDQSNATVIGHGQFHTFDNAIDPTSGTIKAKARVANGEGALFPNQFVNLNITVDTLHQALVVPVTAVRVGTAGPFVYKMTPDKIAHRVNVTTGPSDGTNTVILTGLNGDETVIYEGADKIDDGSPVTTADAHGGADGGGQHKHHSSQ